MSAEFPVFDPIDTGILSKELALLDIQTEHSRRLQHLGLHDMAIGHLAAAHAYPANMLVSTCVYEHQPGKPELSFGGVALLGRDGSSSRAKMLGRMHVYTRMDTLVMPTTDFRQTDAQAIYGMTVELRRRAKKLGLILCPSIIELFRAPAPDSPEAPAL